jgi:hypothetical protein
MVGLPAEHDLTRQECDDTHGWVNDLLGEVEKERGLKLKAEGVSARLAMEVSWARQKFIPWRLRCPGIAGKWTNFGQT